jgi:hypothetical protein
MGAMIAALQFASRAIYKSQNGSQGFVDVPELLVGHAARAPTEPLPVNRAELFDEYPRGFATKANLWSERSMPCAARRGRDDDH